MKDSIMPRPNDPGYDNPTHYQHFQYQRMVNRVFMIAITLLFQVMVFYPMVEKAPLHTKAFFLLFTIPLSWFGVFFFVHIADIYTLIYNVVGNSIESFLNYLKGK